MSAEPLPSEFQHELREKSIKVTRGPKLFFYAQLLALITGIILVIIVVGIVFLIAIEYVESGEDVNTTKITLEIAEKILPYVASFMVIEGIFDLITAYSLYIMSVSASEYATYLDKLVKEGYSVEVVTGTTKYYPYIGLRRKGLYVAVLSIIHFIILLTTTYYLLIIFSKTEASTFEEVLSRVFENPYLVTAEFVGFIVSIAKVIISYMIITGFGKVLGLGTAGTVASLYVLQSILAYIDSYTGIRGGSSSVLGLIVLVLQIALIIYAYKFSKETTSKAQRLVERHEEITREPVWDTLV